MPFFFKCTNTHTPNTRYVEKNLTFLPTFPFYEKCVAGFLRESKTKRTPSANRHKIPHFRLNTIFLSNFNTVCCIPIHYPIALTNF